LEAWDKIGAVSEVAARVQLYSNLIEEGESHLDAAFEGRDILDFTLGGASKEVQMLTQIIPFLNARMQGLSRVVGAAKSKENRSNFMLRGGLLTAATLALWFINKDEEDYKELEDWDKWTYYHFWIGKHHYRIPKPFEVGALFSSLPETMIDTLYGNNDTKHIADFIGHTATETFSISAPQLFRPIIEQWANKSFFTGRPIVGDRLKGLMPGEQKEPWTSETMQLIGKALNISPKRAEVLVRGYFAAFGKFILDGTDIIAENAFNFPEQPTKRIDDYPLVGRFLKQRQPARYSKRNTWFYDTYNEMDEALKTLNHYKQTGNYQKAKKIATDKKEALRLKRYFNKVKRELSRINSRIRHIYASNMTADVKKEKIDNLLERRNQIIYNAYERYKK
jgi:hypothetical protein